VLVSFSSPPGVSYRQLELNPLVFLCSDCVSEITEFNTQNITEKEKQGIESLILS